MAGHSKDKLEKFTQALALSKTPVEAAKATGYPKGSSFAAGLVAPSACCPSGVTRTDANGRTMPGSLKNLPKPWRLGLADMAIALRNVCF
jgi:hypothetical protein